ncbi:MAG TPA: hypothetical protein ENJ75_00030 [Candidatus Kaiserbacteria bacterium]|nr:hypothetical protein [Candidatus Kaiserbacteria bacterium]
MKKQQKVKLPETINVTISSPDEILWRGKAESISSENSVGPFDILPEHSNFITLVKDKPIVIRTPRGEETFTYKNSVISVQNEEVAIYADI